MRRGRIELLLGVAVVGLIGWVLLTQAQATRQAASAARVAASGQTVTSLGLVLVVGVLVGVLLAGGGVVVFLWAQLQRAQRLARRRQEPGSGRWQAGPNAYWGRADEPPRDLPTGAHPLDALVQLEVLRMLREMRPPERPAALPLEDREREGSDENEDVAWREWY